MTVDERALKAAVNAYCSSIGHRSDTRGPLREIRDAAIHAAILAYEAAKPAPAREDADPAQAEAGGVLDQDRVPTWPPVKHALWYVITGEKLNDGHYINAYQLTDKLYDAVLSALASAPKSSGADYAGDITPHDDKERGMAVLRDAYDFDIADDGTLCGLVAGDQGWASTHIRITTPPATGASHDGE